MAFAPRAKVEETVRGWFGKGFDPAGPSVLARALALAADLAITLPSASGSTAIDRMLRQRRPQPGEEDAYDSLRRIRFRLLRITGEASDGSLLLDDMADGGTVRLYDDIIPVLPGLMLAMRLCPIPVTDGFIAVSAVTPLDDSTLAVAQPFIRSGGKGLSNPHRCAEAIYRHVLRHGGLEVPGITDISERLDAAGDFPYGPEDSDLDALAFSWVEGEPTADELALARRMTDAESIIEAVSTGAFARHCGRDDLATGYRKLASVMMETVQRRARSGWGGRVVSLDAVAAEIDRAAAAGECPPVVREWFDDLRRQVRVSSAGSHHDADLNRLIQRIQALRAKTVDQGCTEEEALAAAEKVAELLDRYGLSLSELDLRRQACEGVGIETDRRRTGPIDECVPAVAAYFDCRTWIEKTATGFVRHVFFGLPADVEAAHYLYDLIEIAFATETRHFKTGAVYADLESGERRSGTNSFQIGLAHGIACKLHSMREEREAAMVRSSGRDLVPIKASVVDDELDSLGINFTVKGSRARRTVLSDAYEAGSEAAQRFDIHPGLNHRRGRRPER
ncbi:DUF7168 domain-containing protein [Magnetospirillum moscoviense]|uniref:DUF7168 domain-containing protein n=1 Tax=Magnetospirillum moscoviense TaxID=1437059 RepID=UPI0012E86F80|nr:DUF2786 domain-containing protein [Magnetospirillum moscoviense]